METSPGRCTPERKPSSCRKKKKSTVNNNEWNNCTITYKDKKINKTLQKNSLWYWISCCKAVIYSELYIASAVYDDIGIRLHHFWQIQHHKYVNTFYIISFNEDIVYRSLFLPTHDFLTILFFFQLRLCFTTANYKLSIPSLHLRAISLHFSKKQNKKKKNSDLSYFRTLETFTFRIFIRHFRLFFPVEFWLHYTSLIASLHFARKFRNARQVSYFFYSMMKTRSTFLLSEFWLSITQFSFSL